MSETKTLTLAEFPTARIDEDEAAARVCHLCVYGSGYMHDGGGCPDYNRHDTPYGDHPGYRPEWRP